MDVWTEDNCRLWTAAAGHGKPLIMCHGGPGLWDMAGSLADRLTDSFQVIRWDQRGCGRSERRGPYSVTRCVADLDAVIGQSTSTALFGHSWGATLALRYALDHPDRVSALVYACGTGLGWAWREPFQQAIAARLAAGRDHIQQLQAQGHDREAAILQWSADFEGARAREHAEEMAIPWFGINQDCYTQIWSELQRTWPDDELIAECRQLEVPVLILDGARDLRPRWAVDSLENALPRVSRVTIPDAGHIPWLEAPEAVAGHLLDFLERSVHA